MTRTLLVRADASVQSGTGHVMRCLALAQAWQKKGGTVTFLSRCQSAALRRRVRAEGIRLVPMPATHPDPTDLQVTTGLVQRLAPDWLVIDGYHFGPDYQQAARAAGARVMVIDDLANCSQYHADVLLNQNLGAERLRYRCDPDTRLLLGTRYALLRSEFSEWRNRRRRVPRHARRVLVTMGGSDPGNVSLQVIRALRRVPVDRLETVVLVGAGNPHRAVLESEVRKQARGECHLSIKLEFGAPNVAELMAWADIAVSAGGSTSWELACLGLPSLLLVAADNQRAVVRALAAAGVARRTTLSRLPANLAALSGSADDRRMLVGRGRELVDGNGCGRVVARMKAASLVLRRARPGDSRLMWRWRNERATRTASFNSGPVPWPDHERWFAARLGSPRYVLYIAEAGSGVPVGQARCDILGRQAVISIGLDRRSRGEGLGAALALRGSEQCFRDSRVERIWAHIKPENERSLRAFRDAGYAVTGTARIRGHTTCCLVLRRTEST